MTDEINPEWSVFPVQRDKSPWPGTMWKDPGVARPRSEWPVWPQGANVAIHCGKSGLVVVDEDTPGAVEEWLGYVPNTYTVSTGRGSHFYFYALGRDVKNGPIYPGVDIKSGVGYVVGPGSKHENGNFYRVVRDVPLQPLPAEVGKDRDAPSGAEIEIDLTGQSFDLPRHIPEHERNDTLYRYASSLVSRGIRSEEGVALLRIAFESCTPPYREVTPEDMLNRAFRDYGPVAQFEREVKREVQRLKVREVAQERLQEEKDAAQDVVLDVAMLGEVLERPAQPRARVDSLMPWEASTLLVAQRKVGKTTMVLNLARSLLTGEPFLDAFEVRPLTGTVAILNYEVSSATLAMWADEAKVPRSGLVLVNLRGTGNPLSKPRVRGQLAQALRAARVETVVVDPFGRAFAGRDQNSASEVTPFLTDLDRFAREEVGARDLVLVAHAGWGEDGRVRGSSTLEDWPDSIITLTQKNGHRYMGAKGRDVDMGETRTAFDPVTRRVSLAEGTPEGDTEAVKVARLKPVVVQFVQDNPGCSNAAVERGVTGRGPLVRLALAAAVEGGLVRQERGARGFENYPTEAPRPTSSDLVPDEVNAPRPSSRPLGRDEDEHGVDGATPSQGRDEVVIDLTRWKDAR